eukprot:CAMPEP_0177535282 /NCGR_PEP_ID=MMETSP0369-20130122/56467_1 /TAXON_ID=447022 ORGANISM="Scrippsiella hangoei-like, Strain SHHI-4" /NCGR_SAMPLE_ID=MMETSP0369 /ASSEMBLY_ACC=CAM_ASM_000364 /LENGTH=149 /DNA_ID=CAMNT_0019017429 /DNA_START=1 /DNA_END=451 /DNA_ORIENTATION=+
MVAEQEKRPRKRFIDGGACAEGGAILDVDVAALKPVHINMICLTGGRHISLPAALQKLRIHHRCAGGAEDGVAVVAVGAVGAEVELGGAATAEQCTAAASVQYPAHVERDGAAAGRGPEDSAGVAVCRRCRSQVATWQLGSSREHPDFG